MIDVLEHAAYCDGQREEDPDGFFFDLSLADYDSDCEGDPFANGYLSEDEYEFPENYTPEPHVSAKVADQVYFLYETRGLPVSALCAKFKLSSERVSAIIHLKRSEPAFIASGRKEAGLESLVGPLYEGAFGGGGTLRAGPPSPPTTGPPILTRA